MSISTTDGANLTIAIGLMNAYNRLAIGISRAFRAKSGTSSSEIRRNKALIRDVEKAEIKHRGWPGESRRLDRDAHPGQT